MGVRKLRLIHSPTPEWEVQRAFYRDVLRLPETGGWDFPGDRGAFLGELTAEVEVMEQDAAALGIFPGAAPGWHLALEVDALDAEYERLGDFAGVVLTEIRRQPWGSRDFLIRDPAGNQILIFEGSSEPQ